MDLLERVVAVRKRTLDEGHPDRLPSEHELARVYQSASQILLNTVPNNSNAVDRTRPDNVVQVDIIPIQLMIVPTVIMLLQRSHRY